MGGFFFSLIFNFNHHYAMHRFWFISRSSYFEKMLIKNTKYFVIFGKKAWFGKKECIAAMFPTLASIGTHRKTLDFMKNHVSFSIWRNCKCARDIIRSYPISVWTVSFKLVRSNKATQSYFFSFFFSCFSVYLLFCLCLCFFILHLVKHREKTSTCKLSANLQVIDLLLFSVHRLT